MSVGAGSVAVLRSLWLGFALGGSGEAVAEGKTGAAAGVWVGSAGAVTGTAGRGWHAVDTNSSHNQTHTLILRARPTMCD